MQMDFQFIVSAFFFLTIIRESFMSCTHSIVNGQVPWWCYTHTGSRCPYSCDEGYDKNEDVRRISCSSSGEWLPVSSTTFKRLCLPKSCPNMVPNGKLSDDCDGKVGTTCEYFCNTGYQKNTTVSTVLCEPSTNWSSDPHLLCTSHQQCSYGVDHGELDLSCQRIPGESCHFTCHEGYILSQASSSSEITCESSLVWSQPLSSLCEEILCPSAIPNGSVSPGCSRAYKRYCRYYYCNYGYTKSAAEPSLRCNASGQWYWDESQGNPCARTEELCPSKIQNGNIVWHCHRQHGAYCTYGCNNGCTEDQSVTWLICRNNSEWNKNTDTLCTCGPETTATESVTATSAVIATTVLYLCSDTIPNGQIDSECNRRSLSSCGYMCDDGCFKQYFFLYCTSRRTWDYEKFACICNHGGHVTSAATVSTTIRIVCPYYIRNGYVSGTCSRAEFSICDVYTCNVGCTNMEISLHCTSFGSWSNEWLACSCQDTTSPSKTETTELTYDGFNNTPIIIGVISAAVALSVALLVCFCIMFRKTRQQSQPSINYRPPIYYNHPEPTRSYNGTSNRGITPVNTLQNETNSYSSIQQQRNTEENPCTQLQPAVDELHVQIPKPPEYSSIAFLEPKEEPPSYELVLSNPSEFKI